MPVVEALAEVLGATVSFPFLLRPRLLPTAAAWAGGTAERSLLQPRVFLLLPPQQGLCNQWGSLPDSVLFPITSA